MLGEQLNNRQRAFFLVALMSEPSALLELTPYLEPSEAQALERAYQEWQGSGSQAQRGAVLAEIKRLACEERQSSLREVHVDWIIEALRDESPRMVACILRYLPSEQVQVVLDNLPEDTLKDLPLMAQTFAVDPELIHVIKDRFESAFKRPPSTAVGASFIDFIALLTTTKLHLLFRELGVREVAMAFTTLNDQTIQLILRRLPQREAVLLRERLKKPIQVEEGRLKMAQNHVLSMDLQGSGRQNMIYQLAFQIYSKALLPAQAEGADYIQQKFSHAVGGLLKRAMEKNLSLNSAKTVAPYRREIEALLEELGLIG